MPRKRSQRWFSASTRTINIQATMPNPDEALLPGMFVNAAVVLPDQAPDEEHEVAFADDQFRVALLPLAMVLGVA